MPPGPGLQHLTAKACSQSWLCMQGQKQADTVVGYRWCFRVIAGKALSRHRTIRLFALTLSSRVSQLLSKLLVATTARRAIDRNDGLGAPHQQLR